MRLLDDLTARLGLLSANGLPFAYGDVLAGCQQMITDEQQFITMYRHDPRMDFVYDRRLQVFFCYLTTSSHETMMRILYEHYTGDLSMQTWDAADQYIIDGHGMFKSRAALHGTIMHGQGFAMSPELRMAVRMDLEVLE